MTIALADLEAHGRDRPRNEDILCRPTRGQRLSASCKPDSVPEPLRKEPFQFEQAPPSWNAPASLDPRRPVHEQCVSAMVYSQIDPMPDASYDVVQPRQAAVLPQCGDNMHRRDYMQGGQLEFDVALRKSQVDIYNPSAFGPNAMIPVKPAGLAVDAQDPSVVCSE